MKSKVKKSKFSKRLGRLEKALSHLQQSLARINFAPCQLAEYLAILKVTGCKFWLNDIDFSSKSLGYLSKLKRDRLGDSAGRAIV